MDVTAASDSKMNSDRGSCPCGTTIPKEKCCFNKRGEMQASRVPTQPIGNPTLFSHQKCYMGFTNNCSKKISGEHIISRAVLALLPQTFPIGGLPWDNPVNQILYTKDSLKSKILCTRHNNALNYIDSAAGKFYERMAIAGRFAIGRDKKLPGPIIVNGYALEAWAGKTLMNLYFSKAAADNGISKFGTIDISSDSITRALINQSLSYPNGLWLHMENDLKHGVDQFSLAPISDIKSGALIGLDFQVGVLRFTFVMNANRKVDGYLRNKKHRPSIVVLKAANEEQNIFFVWDKIIKPGVSAVIRHFPRKLRAT